MKTILYYLLNIYYPCTELSLYYLMIYYGTTQNRYRYLNLSKADRLGEIYSVGPDKINKLLGL